MANILIVDDEPEILRLLRKVLERRGHTVLDAGDGKAAARILPTAQVDLVLTDIFMPEVDGFEFIGTVKKALPGVPIVAMSGGGVMPKGNVLVTASVLGVEAILEKPFEVEAVGELVDRLLPAG